MDPETRGRGRGEDAKWINEGGLFSGDGRERWRTIYFPPPLLIALYPRSSIIWSLQVRYRISPWIDTPAFWVPYIYECEAIITLYCRLVFFSTLLSSSGYFLAEQGTFKSLIFVKYYTKNEYIYKTYSSMTSKCKSCNKRRRKNSNSLQLISLCCSRCREWCMVCV